MAALKLNEVERALTGSTQLKRILFDRCWLVSWATVTSYLERCGITIGRANACKLLPVSTHCVILLMPVQHEGQPCSHVCGTVCVHSQLWKTFAELKGNVTNVVNISSLMYVCTYT